ncbi:MAG: methylmalonyl-CoA mutase family protein, partial [Planctomycetota bacterium]
TNRSYDRWAAEQASIAQRLFQLDGALEALESAGGDPAAIAALQALADRAREELDPGCRAMLEEWDALVAAYTSPEHEYQVRGRAIRVPQFTRSLSGLDIPKVALPRYEAFGERLRWLLTENVPGRFPFAAGVFPFKRTAEDPTRMFAGEGGPERTNRRFHYVAFEQPAKRLSTAFDSVTLYGEDPAVRPDIYGKVGNAGVSICTVDDAKKLYSGFDLCAPNTSVSMTINGPAPMILAFFLNAAIDQECEKHIRENGLESDVQAKIDAIYAARGLPRPRYEAEIPHGHNGLGLALLGVSGDQVLPADVYAQLKQRAISTVRGTVQADILK